MNVFRLQNDQVHRELGRDFAPYLESLIELVAGLHDDQQIHIAVRIRFAVGKGAKENNLVRLKSFGNTSRIAPNNVHWHIGPTIPLAGLVVRSEAAFGPHTTIVRTDGRVSPAAISQIYGRHWTQVGLCAPFFRAHDYRRTALLANHPPSAR